MVRQSNTTPSPGELLVTGSGGGGGDVNITEVGGAAITLGQKTSANSFPVVIASDQSAIPVTTTPSGTQDVNLTKVAGASVATGHGTAAGALRVELPTDGTGVVGIGTGSAQIGHLEANQSVNVAQINGVTPLMGAGNTGTGSPRVTIATDQATLPTSEVAPTTIFNGKTSVTTAGTRVTLASSTTVKSVTIKALAANTGTIYVGNSTVASSNGFALAAGDSVSMDLANLNTVNLDCSVSGEGVTYIAVN